MRQENILLRLETRKLSRASTRENLLLASLSGQTRRALDGDLIGVTLRPQQLIQRPRNTAQVIFPCTCVLSIISRTNDGQSVDNAVIGYEGVWALGPEAQNINGMVQIGGEAYAMPWEAFERHLECSEFRGAVLGYSHRLMSFTCQSAICQAFHTAEQRLARWLLSLRDRTDCDELLLTQDVLANMLGVHRPTVTIAARVLQAAGMIRYRYGRVSIIDRSALQEAACECYRLAPGPRE